MKVKEEWWQKGSAIVSNLPTGHDDKGNLEYFGGHCVCESVPARVAPLLVNARRLWFALAEIVLSEPHGRFAEAYQVLCDADPNLSLRKEFGSAIDPVQQDAEQQTAVSDPVEPICSIRESEIDIGDYVYVFKESGGPVCCKSVEWVRYKVLKKRVEYVDGSAGKYEFLLDNNYGNHWRGLEGVYTPAMAKRLVAQWADEFFTSEAEGK
ncbi:MAG: hypothetical protein AMXMBFR84_37540 [Candidatus Hydrogenedentota bacterium]